jgi:hypothetical protein
VIFGRRIDSSNDPSTSCITISFLVVGSMTFRREAAFAAAIFSESFPEAALEASAFWRFSRWASSSPSFWMVGTWGGRCQLISATGNGYILCFLQSKEACRNNCLCKHKKRRLKTIDSIDANYFHEIDSS